jgi:homospermidine synthase
METNQKTLKKYTDQGLIYVREKITRENLNQVLSKYLDSGGLIIDLGVNIGTKDIIKWCHDHQVLYVNVNVH